MRFELKPDRQHQQENRDAKRPASIVWFKDISKGDIGIVGGKGANLGEMARNNFPVPPGFVVTAQAYFNYLDEARIRKEVVRKADSIDIENTEQLERVAKEIRNLILNTPMSESLAVEIKKAYNQLSEKKLAFITSSENEYVAVRSSATAEDLPEASFAGQQETYLNILGADEVVDAVKKCWASLFTARATYYRRKNNFPTDKVGIAVVVQKMVNSEIAGVMFTADPTGDESKIVIEGAYGLGEVVVGGTLTPDHYVVEKGSVKIIWKKISEQPWMIIRAGGRSKKEIVQKKQQGKQKLDDEMIVELAKIGKQIEAHYKAPQDIEWAVENSELYIVQSRAITTLGLKAGVEEAEKAMIEVKDKPIVTGLPASPGIVTAKVIVVPDVEDIKKVSGGEVLVTTMTSPDWVPIMRRSAAIITDEGGLTCHAAIVSRELGIPCIVGTEYATARLRDGQIVTVDAYNGKVYAGSVALSKPKVSEEEKIEVVKESEIEEVEEALEEEIEEEEGEIKSGKFAGETAEEIKEDEELVAEIKEAENAGESDKEKKLVWDLLGKLGPKVKVNVALPDAAQSAAATGADGVGLLRAEHMITAEGVHPAEYLRQGQDGKLVDAVKKGVGNVAKLFRGKPVWYRTFDARTDEFRNLKGGDKEPKEDNPMLGWHGIRRDLDEESLLRAQFKAIKQLRDEGLKNVGVMLPFVQHVDEYKQARKVAEECGLEPGNKDFEFGIMVETPASVWTIDEFIEAGIDFVSFGTNDLTQLTLGIDRNNEHIQKQFTELHPAILRQLKYVIDRCRKAGVKTSICGQAGSNPEMVRQLVRFGIGSVSANIDSVKKIRQVVMLEEKKMLLEKAGNDA